MSPVYIQINTILTAHIMVCLVVLACLLLLFTGRVISPSDSVDCRSTKPVLVAGVVSISVLVGYKM